MKISRVKTAFDNGDANYLLIIQISHAENCHVWMMILVDDGYANHIVIRAKYLLTS